MWVVVVKVVAVMVVVVTVLAARAVAGRLGHCEKGPGASQTEAKTKTKSKTNKDRSDALRRSPPQNSQEKIRYLQSRDE